jgi:hypothetical protein
MSSFKWLLNWSLSEVYTSNGDVIPVRKDGVTIGYCKIIIRGDNIVGDFHLSISIDDSLYVLYTISYPNKANQRWLEGILLVDYYDGIENRARKIEDMEVLE